MPLLVWNSTIKTIFFPFDIHTHFLYPHVWFFRDHSLRLLLSYLSWVASRPHFYFPSHLGRPKLSASEPYICARFTVIVACAIRNICIISAQSPNTGSKAERLYATFKFKHISLLCFLEKKHLRIKHAICVRYAPLDIHPGHREFNRIKQERLFCKRFILKIFFLKKIS